MSVARFNNNPTQLKNKKVVPWNPMQCLKTTQYHTRLALRIICIHHQKVFLVNCQFVNLESHSSLSLPLKLDTVVKAAECFYLCFYLRWLPFVIGHILKVGVKRAKYQLKPFYSSNLINFCLFLPTAPMR